MHAALRSYFPVETDGCWLSGICGGKLPVACPEVRKRVTEIAQRASCERVRRRGAGNERECADADKMERDT